MGSCGVVDCRGKGGWRVYVHSELRFHTGLFFDGYNLILKIDIRNFSLFDLKVRKNDYK